MQLSRLSKVALPCALLTFAAVPMAFADDYDKKTDVTISQPIQVPGAILEPGTYTFKLLNITANRHVVQVRSQDGKKTYTITMTAAARRIEPTSKPVISFYETAAGNPPAARMWYWPGDLDGQEFLYSHKEAQEIAQRSKQKVNEEAEATAKNQANAPAEQHVEAEVPASTQQFTSRETEKVEPAAQEPAKQEQPVAQEEHAKPAEEQTVAQNNAPADNSSANSAARSTDQQQSVVSSNARDYASNTADQSSSRPSSLPQTASDLPLIALFGLASMTAAVAVRFAARRI